MQFRKDNNPGQPNICFIYKCKPLFIQYPLYIQYKPGLSYSNVRNQHDLYWSWAFIFLSILSSLGNPVIHLLSVNVRWVGRLGARYGLIFLQLVVVVVVLYEEFFEVFLSELKRLEGGSGLMRSLWQQLFVLGGEIKGLACALLLLVHL